MLIPKDIVDFLDRMAVQVLSGQQITPQEAAAAGHLTEYLKDYEFWKVEVRSDQAPGKPSWHIIVERPTLPGKYFHASGLSELRISGHLRAILAPLPIGADIPDSGDFRTVLGILEQYLPATLAEVYPEWKQESLDGFYPLVSRKTGEEEMEFFGLCILISDQTTTPIHFCLQVSSTDGEVSWLVCRLGEAGEQGMVRDKSSLDAIPKRLHALEGRADRIEWVYRVTFGNRRT